jgi:hypothetical protein
MVLPPKPEPDRYVLDICLNGGRNYVQASQILARTADIVHLRAPDAQMVAASFNHITSRKVIASFSQIDDVPDADQPIGRAQFVSGDLHIPVSFFETDEAAPTRDLNMNVDLQMTRNSRFHYSNQGSFEDYLDMIIQSVKAHHIAAYPGINDVWFTGIRGCSIPVQSAPRTLAGHIDIDVVRTANNGNQWQTISKVIISTDSGCTNDAVISFAYKTAV